MNYTVEEKTGNILLKTSPKEASIISKALVSKNLILRKDPVNNPVCAEILKMHVRLDAALIESNKAILNRSESETFPSLEQSPMQALPNTTGFWQRIINFFDAPFTTSDFEKSSTRCGVPYKIEMMEYERQSYPSKVHGTVKISDHAQKIVFWNGRGKCRDNMNKRCRQFDLVRPDQKERDSSLFMGLSIAGIIITLFVYNLTL